MPFQEVTIDEQDMQSVAERMDYAEWLGRYEAGLLLNEARRFYEFTQDELAERSQVSQAYISKIESGHGNPPIGRLAALFGAMSFRLRMYYEPLTPQSATSATETEQAASWAGVGHYESLTVGMNS